MRSSSTFPRPGTASWLRAIFNDPRLVPPLTPQFDDPAVEDRVGMTATALAETLGHRPMAADGEPEVSYQRLQPRLGRVAPRHRRGDHRQVPARRQWASGIAMAAGVTLVVAAGWGLSSQWNGISGRLTIQDYVTRPAERTQVTLPDGTTVILAPASRLTLSAGFNRTDRHVTLEGQAYFTVRDDAKRAFRIAAGGSITQVLGTAFSVRAYPTDAMPLVAVAEGKVAFGANANTVVLLAGDVGELPSGQSPRIRRDVPTSEVFGWTRGQLVYNKVPVRDIIPDLERTYNIDIRLVDPAIADLPLRATLSGDDIDDILSTLELALLVDIDRHGNTVTIQQRR